jgi:hypothetical protein
LNLEIRKKKRANDRTRTGDPFLTMEVLYQLSYIGKKSSLQERHLIEAKASDFSFMKSGRRDSNPRPSAWKADALPTELLPLENVDCNV